MSTEERLTKKQRKSLAHRERGQARKKALAQAIDVPEPDVLDPEAQDVLFVPLDATDTPSNGKKRKLEEADETSKDESSGKRKKRKKAKAAPAEDDKKRYILFVGNLSYTTTPETLVQYFTFISSSSSSSNPNAIPINTPPDASSTDPPKVRMLTKKGETNSKGCAFVEFTNSASIQRALKLHHTTLDGRRINVEMTVGGGGTGTTRTKKLVKKNKIVADQRAAVEMRAKIKERDEHQAASRRPYHSGTGANAVVVGKA